VSVVNFHRIVPRRDQDPGGLRRHLLHHGSGENRRTGKMPGNEKLVPCQVGFRHDGLIVNRNQPIARDKMSIITAISPATNIQRKTRLMPDQQL